MKPQRLKANKQTDEVECHLTPRKRQQVNVATASRGVAG